MGPVNITRRRFLVQSGLLGGALALSPLSTAFGEAAVPIATVKRQPVILATDIGDDIDDTWALGFLLKCPELDLRLVVGDYGKAQYRAKLLAKFLHTVGAEQVPVGVGLDIEPHGEGPQAAWIADYDLKTYPGKVHADGVQAMIDTILLSPDPVTVIGIGPLPNVAAAFEREPRIATRARFVGMQGSIRLGYGGAKKPAPEWNVKAAPQACRQVFAAPWDITITPLDTCGLVLLSGERYHRLALSKDIVAATVLENYRIWNKGMGKNPEATETHSSTLFDTVAVCLAFRTDFFAMEQLGVRVTDEGFTVVDEKARKLNIATSWRSLDGFRDFLTSRLAEPMSVVRTH